jgi:hypothetical protein
MSFRDTIKVTTLPTLKLKELSVIDDTKASAENPGIITPKNQRSAKEKKGSEIPLVKINSIEITNVDKLIIEESGIIPTIKLIFTDATGALSSRNYPKRDPILSVYIKTGNESFKPIRCDFLITSIRSNQDAVMNASVIHKGATYVMTGELFIPKLYDNVSRSYPNMTSKVALNQIAVDLGLGFAENDFETDDAMTWINPNRNSLHMISEIRKHAYLDDDTLFHSFIDKYYNLNFINVSNQLIFGQELNRTYDTDVDASQLVASQEAAEKARLNRNAYTVPLALNNLDQYRGKPEYIINYSPMGDNGSILKSKGYRKTLYYYDHLLEEGSKFTSFYLNPAKIKGAEEKDVYLIPEDEDLKSNMTKKWMNIEYGNAHREWNASAITQDHNDSELNKIKLKVETAGINFQVYRGCGIPVVITTPAVDRKLIDSFNNDSIETGESFSAGTTITDPYLSGRYYVNSVKYIFDSMDPAFTYRTEFQLSRIDWENEKI